MSLSHSPKIVTNGLVFAYDMGNGKKSWKGKPTTNLYADGDYASKSIHPVQNGPWSFPSGVTDPNGNQAIRIDQDGTTSYHGRDITVTIGETYTTSGWIYASTDSDTTALRIAGEQGFAPDATYDLSKKGTWQYVSATGVAATTNARILAYQQSNMTTGYCLFGSIQFEQGYNSPFTNSTRSNTEAIVDWTGNNTITANSLTYNSDGTFSFNGSSDYITAPLSIGTDPLVTVNQWIKRSASFSNAGYWGLGGGAGNNGINGYTSVTDKIGWDLWGQTTFHTGQDYPLDTWVNVCWVKTATTFTTSTLKVYINGVEYPLTTTVRNNSSTVNITSGIAVGRLTSGVAAYHAPGDVEVTQVYNRALSAAEVKQNFSALRGRYGI